MDTSDVYPDLFGDALSYSSQRMAQFASLVTAAATVEARRKTQRNAAKATRSERALHHHRVAPAAVAIGDARQTADRDEVEFLVQRQRCAIVGVNIADHLAEAGRGAGINQLL